MIQAQPPLALTRDEARALMLAAQGLYDVPASPPGVPELRGMVERLGVVQIDTISVVQRSQYLVLWSRLGPFAASLFDSLLAPHRLVLEYWAHAASILPMRDYPYHRLWMVHHAQHMWVGNQRWLHEHPDVLRETLEAVRARGPLASADFESPAGRARTASWDWYGPKDHRRALDILWTTGDLMVHSRRGGQKRFDLRERILAESRTVEPVSDAVLPSLDERRAYLACRTVHALGVVVPSWLWDYFRLAPPPRQTRQPAALHYLQRFVQEGIVVPARIEGIAEEAFVSQEALPLLRDLRAGRVSGRTTLLSPFDNLLWHRARAQALFDYEVCFEAYVPQAKRRYGYYCLAILHRGRIVGRLDPKMDRAAGVLMIQSIFLEPTVEVTPVLCEDLATALRELAAFVDGQAIVFGAAVSPTLGVALRNRLS